jgi:RNA polymerase sigma-70 factor (ECF subfamily)
MSPHRVDEVAQRYAGLWMWRAGTKETKADASALDEALIKARAGDEAAFLLLWDALQPRLLRYLQVAGCDDVDDVAGETWLQVVRDLPKFQKDSADEFRAWLFTIARHRVIDAARSRKRFLEKILSAWQAQPAASAGNPVEDEVLAQLSTQQAVAMVAALSKDQAEVVALRVIAGLDTEAVARLLHKSPGAVRVALHRGLRSLSDDPRIKQIEEVDQ